MRKRLVAIAALALVVSLQVPAPLEAATPSSGTLSKDTPLVTWTGGPFAVSALGVCTSATCDRFDLTIVPPPQDFGVRILVEPDDTADDWDLFLSGPSGDDSSATGGSTERITITNAPEGTYRITVEPFLIRPGATYRGRAELFTDVVDLARAYHATSIEENFNSIPSNGAANFHGSPVKVSVTAVGREAAEPTLGVNRNNTGFYVATTFDTPGGRLARSKILRSRDLNASWQVVGPAFTVSDLELASEPPATLDPWLHVDAVTGRVWSFDLDLVCGAYVVFSDDEGDTWQRSLACIQPVTDHQAIATGPYPSNLTGSYERILYFCFNRVSDSSCQRSRDGGSTYEITGEPAFLGTNDAGDFCGGLHGHIAVDSRGRLFLPKGHCGFPWIAYSDDGGGTWSRVPISTTSPMQHHEVSIAIDAADNVYAVWQDARWNLPVLAISRDRGATWGPGLMVAPPGVHEVNFPTITAGDVGRIAFTFPGTTVNDTGDTTRPWNTYVVISDNVLGDKPMFVWALGNDPADPVHRGDCGPGRCGGMLDFLDIQTSPADGAFWATVSDTCVDTCVSDPTARTKRVGDGIAVRQTGGPSLWDLVARKKAAK